ncbi:vomeronasal type-1 receptor 4-like [Mustela nigripes]|uniref:Vomeronasal type-1 receptor n=1 Tax=Mustela putorius furo TaxID=9669 RepID=A0A8U0NER4_MUSPF|nr:vomeronasal type-1 receptor 4-like [Mustela putorius furo]XP_059239305.1 vomeronasal type-1 receptor 4-like [Mustela nigripes]
MASRDLVIGVIFLIQTMVGILGNFCLLYHYLLLYFTRCRLRPTDLIAKHLTVANSLFLLCKGVPQTMAAFGWNSFPSDFGCKLLFYLHRVSRGVSLGGTCLLSVFQAITISPRDSSWTKLKRKALKHIDFSIFLCWALYMLANILFPIHVIGKWSNRSISVRKDLGYCSVIRSNKITQLVQAALLSFTDVLCLGLMIWASSSMVFILNRHRQRVQHIHRLNNVSPRSSAESRATQSILVLMSTFVSFYSLSSIFQVCIILFDDPSWLLVSISALINGCFPSACPFILMNCISSVFRFYLAWMRNATPTKPMTNM